MWAKDDGRLVRNGPAADPGHNQADLQVLGCTVSRMLRSFLLAYPFMAVYVLLVVPVFIPVTWVSGSIRPIYWMARLGVRIALLLAGVRLRLIHGERARSHPCCVFVANHVSNIEAPALFQVLPRISVIMKDSLGRIPLLGYAMRIGGFVRVDRKARDSRKRALEEAVQTLRSGISMLVFPEGTRNPTGTLLPFRPGPFQMAIEASVPVVPITVHGAAALMPRGARFVRRGEVALWFHEPVATGHLNFQDRIGLMKRVRQLMQSALDSQPTS